MFFRWSWQKMWLWEVVQIEEGADFRENQKKLFWNHSDPVFLDTANDTDTIATNQPTNQLNLPQGSSLVIAPPPPPQW